MAARLARIIVALALLFPFTLTAAPPAPEWRLLTEQQRDILAPLKNEWAGFDDQRKRKWLEVAQRYPNMSLYDQWKLKQRMQEWAKLTPQQREEARERYKEFEQLPPERKETVRQQYETKQMANPPETAPVTNK